MDDYAAARLPVPGPEVRSISGNQRITFRMNRSRQDGLILLRQPVDFAATLRRGLQWKNSHIGQQLAECRNRVGPLPREIALSLRNNVRVGTTLVASLDEQGQELPHGSIRFGTGEKYVGIEEDAHQRPNGNYRRPERVALVGTLRPLAFAFKTAASSASAKSNSCSRFTE